jgi:hypothetical protein
MLGALGVFILWFWMGIQGHNGVVYALRFFFLLRPLFAALLCLHFFKAALPFTFCRFFTFFFT